MGGTRSVDRHIQNLHQNQTNQGQVQKCQNQQNPPHQKINKTNVQSL